RRETLTLAMHRLLGIYAQRFNRRYGRKGHLFEERFASWVIEDEEHLWAAIRYVRWNPVAAGLCRDPRDWLWCWTRHAPAPGREPRGLSLSPGPNGRGRAAATPAAGEPREPRAGRAPRPRASARCPRSGSGRSRSPARSAARSPAPRTAPPAPAGSDFGAAGSRARPGAASARVARPPTTPARRCLCRRARTAPWTRPRRRSPAPRRGARGSRSPPRWRRTPRRVPSSPIAVARPQPRQPATRGPGTTRADQPRQRLPQPREARRQPVSGHRRPRERPEREHGPLEPGRHAFFDQVAPQVEEQLVERDLHRAGLGTRPAQRRRVGQRRRPVEPDQEWKQHRPHRAG